MLKSLLATAIATLAGIVHASDLPVLRLGALETGTVNWELDTILSNGFDTANGFTLEVVPMASNDASDIAFLGGEIDVMVSDVIWAAAQRMEGRDVKFVPYSTAVGSIMVKADSGINNLSDLAGKRIGIAGGPLDKSWLIMQAYSKQSGFDLAANTTQEFGAPPIMFKAALSGDIDAIINFWHFQAKAKAAGLVEIASVSDAATALGLNPDTPLLGYILNGDIDPNIARGLATASRQAKNLLKEDPAAWEAVRARMNAADDAQFEALKEGFIAGIPVSEKTNPDEVNAMLALMAELGGEDLVGKATSLPEGLFFE